ncbi:MAG: FkbM family methyltransferase [Cytophagaceae bacterium]|nr:FkbM family methyltransferase [Cytophagaceae bacterium]
MRLLERCFPRPRIHAFEPASASFAALSGQAFGKHVQLHQLAMGETVGEAVFRNYGHSDLSSFLPMNPDRTENIFAEETLVSVETVQVDTPDHFCNIHSIPEIDLLKIDTQGFELAVLRGGAGLFKEQKLPPYSSNSILPRSTKGSRIT